SCSAWASRYSSTSVPSWPGRSRTPDPTPSDPASPDAAGAVIVERIAGLAPAARDLPARAGGVGVTRYQHAAGRRPPTGAATSRRDVPATSIAARTLATVD